MTRTQISLNVGRTNTRVPVSIISGHVNYVNPSETKRETINLCPKLTPLRSNRASKVAKKGEERETNKMQLI